MTLPKILGKVHCHVCPLKDVCQVGNDEVSFRFHHFWDTIGFPANYSANAWEQIEQDHSKKWDKMQHITLNCPLKKLVEK